VYTGQTLLAAVNIKHYSYVCLTTSSERKADHSILNGVAAYLVYQAIEQRNIIQLYFIITRITSNSVELVALISTSYAVH